MVQCCSHWYHSEVNILVCSRECVLLFFWISMLFIWICIFLFVICFYRTVWIGWVFSMISLPNLVKICDIGGHPMEKIQRSYQVFREFIQSFTIEPNLWPNMRPSSLMIMLAKIFSYWLSGTESINAV